MLSDEKLKHIISSTCECTICGDEVALVVDHDHKTNEVRGMICNLCNKGLGLFRDNPDLLEFARIYLLAAKNDEEAEHYVQKHSGLSFKTTVN